jgi:hypothetical protein
MSFLIRTTRKQNDNILGRGNPLVPRSKINSSVQSRLVGHRSVSVGSAQAQTQIYRTQTQKQDVSTKQEHAHPQSVISMAEGKCLNPLLILRCHIFCCFSKFFLF